MFVFEYSLLALGVLVLYLIRRRKNGKNGNDNNSNADSEEVIERIERWIDN